MQNIENKERMEGWKVQSSDENGFHKVITPDTCECKEAQMFRLNLPGVRRTGDASGSPERKGQVKWTQRVESGDGKV